MAYNPILLTIEVVRVRKRTVVASVGHAHLRGPQGEPLRLPGES